jgi:hypothetical protein
LLSQERLWIAVRRGTFSSENDVDLAKIQACARGETPPDLEGASVFQFLADLALKKPERKVELPG